MRARLLRRLREVPPLIRLMLALVAGILMGQYAWAGWPYGVAAAAAAAGVLALPRRRLLAGALLLMALGAWRSQAVWHPAVPAEGTYRITATVADNILPGASTQRHTRLKDIALDGVPMAGQAYWSFYGQELAGVSAGDRVTFTGQVYDGGEEENPGGFDFRAYLYQSGMSFGVYGVEDWAAEPGPFDLACLMARVRMYLTQRLCAVMGQEDGAYAAAMLLGEKSLLDQEERQAFSRLGVAHILAVSGFHVGVLAKVLEALTRHMRLGRRVRYAVTLVALAAYCLLTGGSSPTVRATVLWALYGLGRLCHRRGDPLTLLSAAAGIILLAAPAQLMAAGFQLSFGAMVGIGLVTPWLKRLHCPQGRASRWVWNALCLTAGAQTGLLLPLCWWFQQLPLLGLMANLVVYPWASMLIYLYLLTTATLGIPGVRETLGAWAAACSRATVTAVQALAGVPGAYLWTARPGPLGWLGAGGILASVSNRSWWRRRTRCLVGGTAALCFAVSVMPVSQPITTWTQLSVGTADAAVLETGGEVWAIDAGEGDDLAVYLRQRRLSLTGLILTHLHSDHAGGVRYLLESGIPVERCYLPWGAELSAAVPSVAEAVETLAARGTQLCYLQAGDVLELPTGRMQVLWPQAEKVRRDADLNDFCLVTLWELGEARLLSMSDLPGTYEPYVATPADVLKVGHHGQADSTGSAFAQIVAPEVALVSAGRNLDLAKLADRLPGTALYWTGDCGAVTLRFSGKRFEVSTWLTGQKE